MVLVRYPGTVYSIYSYLLGNESMGTADWYVGSVEGERVGKRRELTFKGMT